MKIRIVYILILIAFFYSCEKTVNNIDLEKKDPKLVLHGFICPDNEILTNLTVSKSSLSGDNILHINNGLIEIYEGETKIHDLVHDEDGYFLSQENNLGVSKEYTIRANAPNFPEVSCRFVIPKKIDIISIDTTVRIFTETWEWGETEERKDYQFHIKFNDPDEEENYYIMLLYRNSWMYIYNEMNEPIDSFLDKQYIYTTSDDISAEFGLHDTWIEQKYEDEVYASRGIGFSDDFFQGKTKTFSFSANHYELLGWEGEISTYYIVLKNISKDYYTFLKSMSLYEDTEYDPFAQKVNVYNNVEGGFGIIGTYSKTTDSIYIEGNTPKF